MAESFVDSFKTELIADRVWRTRAHLELAIVEYVAWFKLTGLRGIRSGSLAKADPVNRGEECVESPLGFVGLEAGRYEVRPP
jgi:integrase-like protein